MKWEYKSLMFAGSAENWILGNIGPKFYDTDKASMSFFTDIHLDNKLNEIARDGWELFQVLPFAAGTITGQSGAVTGSFTFIFKRTAKATAQP